VVVSDDTVLSSKIPLKNSKQIVSIFNAPRKYDLLQKHSAKINWQAYVVIHWISYTRLILSAKRLCHCKAVKKRQAKTASLTVHPQPWRWQTCITWGHARKP